MQQEEFKPNPPEMDGVPDMTSLLYLEEDNVIHNLNIRFKKKSVYTNVGSILIAMNPYEWIQELYGEKVMDKYKTTNNDPHCYQIAARAIDNIKSSGMSQSIIICGESGAGKTESAKCCINYVAISRQKDPSDKLVSQIVSVNPILEAFGNAKTVRNNNSSRFGKFTKIILSKFDRSKPNDSLMIQSCLLESYLLEKSRVVFHEPTERNFHIFYQVFHIGDSSLGLSSPDKFVYLASTPEHAKYVTIPKVDDKKNWGKVMQSLDDLKIPDQKRKELITHVAAILHLGNVAFQDDGKGYSKIKSECDSSVAKAAELLQIDKVLLVERLTTKKIKVMREEIVSTLTITEADDNRDSISKSLFSSLFDWLFSTINEFFAKGQKHDENHYIGILDIFGFEAFKRNSFEQFCINFANERLQQLFSESLIIAEQKEYIAEGVFWIPLDIPNNDAIVDLFSDPSKGIFNQLESVCNMPKGTPEIFVSNVFSAHRSNKKLKNVKMSKELSATLNPKEKFNGFLIFHYAEDVVYNCNEFLIKNRDLISDDTAVMFCKSSSSILKQIFAPVQTPKKGKGIKKNIGKVFLDSLNKLMMGFETSTQHFVRCFNPNTKKSNSEWEIDHVRNQLRCAGVIPALKVVKKGYPTRISYEDLETNYKSLVSHPTLEGLNKNEFWQAILVAFGFPPSKYEFGFTKIFFKPNVPFIQEIKKQKGPLNEEQLKRIKKYFVSKRFSRLRGIVISYNRILKRLQETMCIDAIKTTTVLFFAFKRKVEETRLKLKKEREEAERLEKERLEKERLALLEKKRREEEEMIKRSKEEQKKLEEQRRLEEIKRKEEEARQKEEERLRLIELKKKQEEEERRQRIAAMVAVELFFEKEYAKNVENFEESLAVELSEFLLTVKERFEIVVDDSQSNFVADVRIQEPTEDEEVKRYQKEDEEKKNEILREKCEIPEEPQMKPSLDSTGESTAQMSVDTDQREEHMKSGEKMSFETNSKNREEEESWSDGTAKTEAEEKSKSVEITVKWVYMTKMELAVALKDADFSSVDENSILGHLIDRKARNCEVEKVEAPKKPKPSVSKTSSKQSMSGNEGLFMFSLSMTSDGITQKFQDNPILSDPKCFVKILNGELPEVQVLYDCNEFRLIKTPTERTDTHLIIIPKTPIKKSRNGTFSPELRAKIYELGDRAIEGAKIFNFSEDNKCAFILNHNTENWSVVRILKLNTLNIAKQLLKNLLTDFKDWKIEYMSDFIICLSQIDEPTLERLREDIYNESMKTKLLYECMRNINCPVGHRITIIKLFWLMYRYNFYKYVLRKGFVEMLVDELITDNPDFDPTGSKKIFNWLDNDTLDCEHPNFLYHVNRSTLKVLVFCSFYSSKANWEQVVAKNKYAKILKLLINEIEMGEVKSDITSNSVLIMNSSMRKVNKDLRKKMAHSLMENGLAKIFPVVYVKTSHNFFSILFITRFATLLDLLKEVIKADDFLHIIKGIEDVLQEHVKNETITNTQGYEVNLYEFAKSKLELLQTSTKVKKKKKFFGKLFTK